MNFQTIVPQSPAQGRTDFFLTLNLCLQRLVHCVHRGHITPARLVKGFFQTNLHITFILFRHTSGDKNHIYPQRHLNPAAVYPGITEALGDFFGHALHIAVTQCMIEQHKLPIAQIKHMKICKMSIQPFTCIRQAFVHRTGTVKGLKGRIIANPHPKAGKRLVVKNQLRHHFRKGRFIEHIHHPVPQGIRILGSQINNENRQQAEKTGHERIHKGMTHNNSHSQNQIAGKKPCLQSEGNVLAKINKQYQRGDDIKPGTEINGIIPTEIMIPRYRIHRKNRARPRGHNRQQGYRNCRQCHPPDITASPFFRGIYDFGGIIKQTPAAHNKGDKIGHIQPVGYDQRIFLPHFIEFTGQNIRNRHDQIHNHDQPKAPALPRRQLLPLQINHHQN